MNPFLLALILLIGLGIVFLIKLKGGEVAKKKEIPCGGEEEFEANPAADTHFVVVVNQVCSTEAKIQVGLETWTDVVVLRPASVETERPRENPKPGSAYFVTVPRGQKLKVLCPEGETNNKCIVTVGNLSARPSAAIPVNKPDTPVTQTCGSWTEAKLYNLSNKPAVVRIRFTKVCNNPHGPALAPELRTKRIVEPNFNTSTGVGSATQDGTEWKWEGALPMENALEVRCPGSDGRCEYHVQVIG